MEIQVMRERLERVREAARGVGLVIVPGPELRFLVGPGHGSLERLTALVVPADGPAGLVVPALEAPGYDGLPLTELGIDVLPWRDGADDPYKAVAERLAKPERVAISDGMAARHVLALRDVLPDATQSLAGPIVNTQRIRKDDSEVASLRAAAAGIDRVHARASQSGCGPGGRRRRSVRTSRRRSLPRATNWRTS